MKKIETSPEKWPRHVEEYMEWWENMTIEDKLIAKAHYEKVCEKNETNKHHKYPNMYPTIGKRLGELGQKHIYRIWVFRDHVI